MTPDYHFFLGGYDLEMQTIKNLLQQHSKSPVFDKHLTWGAAASHYRNEIKQSLSNQATPVLIELKWDTPDLPADKVLMLDHHQERSGATAPTALEQVFKLLTLPASAWTRWHDLVVVNDKAHIEGLLEYGATEQEIRQVRAADRAAQGVTDKDEYQAQRAIESKQLLFGDQLILVNSQSNKTSPIADRLDPAFSRNQIPNLLILSPDELNFYGKGHIIEQLAKAFQDSWWGGSLPQRGFWGTQKTALYQQILGTIQSCVEEKQNSAKKPNPVTTRPRGPQ